MEALRPCPAHRRNHRASRATRSSSRSGAAARGRSGEHASSASTASSPSRSSGPRTRATRSSPAASSKRPGSPRSSTIPNIIQVIDVGETDGTYWYAMEYVAGVTALDLFRERGPLPEGEVLEVAWQVAQALQHGVDRGLVHGDLKPENILITPEGVAKVVDFGLARLSRKRGWHASREEEPVQGTEGFVAPEILENKSIGDARSDLFALGVTLYELLTTTLPPAPKRGSKLGPDVRERRPNATRRTAELIMRLLSPDPAQRPESAAKRARGAREAQHDHAAGDRVAGRARQAAAVGEAPPRRDDEARGPRGARSRRIVVVAVIVGATRPAQGACSAGPSKPEPRPTPEVQAKPPPESGNRRLTVPPPTPATPKPDRIRLPSLRSRRGPRAASASRLRSRRVPRPDRAAARGIARTGHGERARAEARAGGPPPRRERRRRSRAPRSRARRRAASEPAPPPPAPREQRSGERPAAEPVAVTSTAAAIRVFLPPPASLNAAWTVIVPGRRAVRSPGAPAARLRSEGDGRRGRERRKGEGPHGQDRGEAGIHLAAFRGDRAAPWGPREFTSSSSAAARPRRLRLRFQVVRPTLLASAPAPALKEALHWLERHAGPDGAISANAFSARCKGDRTCDGPGKDACTGGVTALAVLAALRSGESGDWVRSALASLVALQKSDGRFASADDPHGAYTHMIATEATALGWHLLGDADVARRGAARRARRSRPRATTRAPAARGATRSRAATTTRRSRSGRCARCSRRRWPASRSPRTRSTGGAAWIRGVTETNPNDPGRAASATARRESCRPRAGPRAAVPGRRSPRSLTAGALSVALLSGDRKLTDEVAQSGMALVLLCRPTGTARRPRPRRSSASASNNPSADLSRDLAARLLLLAARHAPLRTWKVLRGRSIPEDKKWNLAKVLTPAQRKDGCAAGSFDPLDPWGPELGRAGSTAMLALALANEQYSQPACSTSSRSNGIH